LILFFLTGINQSWAINILDLGAVTSGTINGANFAVFDASKAGRGVYPTFLATQGDANNDPGVNKGYNEFLLIGTDLGCYGRDLGKTLVDLLIRLIEIEGNDIVKEVLAPHIKRDKTSPPITV